MRLWQRILTFVERTCPGCSVREPRRRIIALNPGHRLRKKHPFPRNDQSVNDERDQSQRRTSLRDVALNDDGNTDSTSSLPSSRPASRNSRASSFFGIRSTINDFRYATSRAFLTPLEQILITRMSQVTSAGRHVRVLRKDIQVLIVPDQDSARALAAVRHLVRGLDVEEKEEICADVNGFLTKWQRRALKRVLFDRIEIRVEGTESPCRTPDSVCPGVALLKPTAERKVMFSKAPEARWRNGLLLGDSGAGSPLLERGRPVGRSGGDASGIFVRRTSERPSYHDGAGPHLRGGGTEEGEDNPADMKKTLTRSLLQSIRYPTRLGDDERPHPALWYLAGGRLRLRKEGLGVPTGQTLRERKVLERENREVVGFWGSLAGVREVKKTRSQLATACKKILHPEGAAPPAEEADQPAEATTENKADKAKAGTEEEGANDKAENHDHVGANTAGREGDP